MEKKNNNNWRQAATRITQHIPELWATLLASLPKKKKKKSHEIESGPNTKVSTHSFESP